MNAAQRPPTLAEMPVQHPHDPATGAERRARYFNSGNAFNHVATAVPAAAFRDAVTAARNAVASHFFTCDQAEALALPAPATTPLMLARYASVVAGDPLEATFAASGVIWYVIAGEGTLQAGDEHCTFGSGDVIVTPGGVATTLTAAPASSAVVWCVTDEPLFTFEHAAPRADDASAAFVHYPAREIARQLERVVAAARDDATSGIALIFSTERAEAERTITPTLTLSLNTVPPHEHQRLHRHNSAAVTLVVQGERCWSLVADERHPWTPFATLVTPATAPHAHYNDGDDRAMFLIVQDGGFHQHARTMGFAFLEAPQS